jgi:hypothetical protein
MRAKAVERWLHAGLECCIRVGVYGLDGCVRLPEGHPDRRMAETADEVDQAMDKAQDPFPWGRGHRHIPVEVHGGLVDGPDEDGWIGFDTGHALDYWADEDLAPHLRKDDRIAAHMIGVRLQRDGLGTRWTKERLRSEVNRLAEQLAARGSQQA